MEKPEDNISAQGFQKENDNEEVNLRNIRTYSDDVASLVKNRKVSTAKIIMAEQKKRMVQQMNEEESEEKTSKSKKGALIKFVISIILIGLGGGALWAAINFGIIPEDFANKLPGFKPNQSTIVGTQTIEVLANNKTNGEIKNELLKKLSQIQSDNLDEIVELKVNFIEQTEDGEIKSSINSVGFLNIIGANVNNRFSRSLSEDFTYGVYKEVEPTPFIIFKTDDINISFAEILEWESFMYQDLKDMLKLKPEVPEFIVVEQEVSTTTTDGSEENATTTVEVAIPNPEPKFNRSEFTDIVLSNRDVRAIVDDIGSIIMMYSFIDDETILFTKNINVFQQIIQRLSNQQLLR
jgi:hypothetical protein